MLEGVSYLVLLCGAMPIKYLSPYPELGKDVVFWVGLGHGILFISYAMVAFIAGPEASYITGASLTVDGGTNA